MGYMDIAINHQTITRRRRLRLAVAVALLAGVAAAAWGINRAVAPSVGAGDIVLGEVKRGSIANTINAAGVVIPVHEELVTSSAQTRVAKVRAKAGQQVAAGELLLELDDTSIRLAIDSLKEQLAQQENRVTALTLEMEQKRKQLVSAIELLELDLRSARAKWERSQKLRLAGGVSGEDLLTSELNVKRAEIQLRQQREQIEDTRRSTQTSVEGARLQKSILQKQLEQQKLLQAQAQVRAPFAGMLTWVMEEEGASVGVGQLVARVSELNNYKVEATLSDFHARSLAAGQPVRVEQNGQTLGGHVQTVLPEIQNGTVKLIVTLDQPQHPLLRNKLRVEANIVTEQKDNVLIVAAGPAFNGRGRQDGYVVHDGVARKTPLDLGNSDGKFVEVSGGARLGERIIISDIKRFKDRDSLRISN